MSLSKNEEGSALGESMMVCTYRKTQTIFAHQPVYRCLTCKLQGNDGMCYVCTIKCHQGHETFYDHYGSFFCDCGERGSSFCDALGSSSSEQGMSATTVINKHSNTDKVFECPICLGYMCAPIHLCERGHNVCDSCRCQIQECPLCRGAFTGARNLGMETLGQALEVHCDDCDESVSLASYSTHKKCCSMRDCKCPLMANDQDCLWYGKIFDLMDHCQEKHTSEMLHGRFHSLLLSDIGGENRSQVQMINVDQNVFVFRCDYKASKNVFQAVVQFVNPSVKDRYKYIITFFSDHSKESVVFQKMVRPYWETFQDSCNNKHSVTLHMDQIVSLLQMNVLKFTLEIQEC